MQTKSACIILLLLLAGVFVQVSAQQRVDKTHDGLKGAVKSVSWEIVRFDLVDGKYVEKPRVPAERTTYDEAGNQTRTEYYDDDGNLQNTLVYDFIGKQRVAKSIEAPTSTALVRVVPLPKGTRIDPRYTGRLNRKTEHNLDEQGNEISFIEHGEYVGADKTVYKYDEFDAAGNWIKRTVYKGIKEVEDSFFTRAHPWTVEYRVITYY